jgi:hypothetical protein
MERELLCNSGAILEHTVYWKIMEDSEVNDCVIGYHINWGGDGDPESINEPGPNVLNEVDVIFMKKNIPTFVSCKNKAVDNTQPAPAAQDVAPAQPEQTTETTPAAQPAPVEENKPAEEAQAPAEESKPAEETQSPAEETKPAKEEKASDDKATEETKSDDEKSNEDKPAEENKPSA